MLKKQLHIHHTAEDTSLWPVLRQKVLGLLPPPVRLLYR